MSLIIWQPAVSVFRHDNDGRQVMRPTLTAYDVCYVRPGVAGPSHAWLELLMPSSWKSAALTGRLRRSLMSDVCLQTVGDEIYNGRLAQSADKILKDAADTDAGNQMPDAAAAVVR